MIRKLATIAIALTVGALGFSAQSTAQPSDKGCRVVSLNVTEETVTAPGRTTPTGFRWVRTETVRCGGKTIDITTRGEYQRHSQFH